MICCDLFLFELKSAVMEDLCEAKWNNLFVYSPKAKSYKAGPDIEYLTYADI